MNQMYKILIKVILLAIADDLKINYKLSINNYDWEMCYYGPIPNFI